MADTPSLAFREKLLTLVPNLRAFAFTFVRAADRADDLVQETLVKAWQNQHHFQADTNLKAWLFTILRNVYLSELRKRKYEVEDIDGLMSNALSVPPGQQSHIDIQDFDIALAKLPREQREAIVLIGAEGFAYEEAALMCGCAVGTMKSRVNRARAKLAQLMGLDHVNDLGEAVAPGISARV